MRKQLLAILLLTGVFVIGSGLWYFFQKDAAKDRRLRAKRQDANELRQENLELHQELQKSQERYAQEIERLRKDNLELLKLRNQSHRFLEQSNELAKLRAEPSQNASLPLYEPNRVFITKQNWTNAGYLTPEASLQTRLWAMRETNSEAFFNSLSTAQREEELKNSRTSGGVWLPPQDEKIAAINLSSTKMISDDAAEIEVVIETKDGARLNFREPFKRFGSEWKSNGDRQLVAWSKTREF